MDPEQRYHGLIIPRLSNKLITSGTSAAKIVIQKTDILVTDSKSRLLNCCSEDRKPGRIAPLSFGIEVLQWICVRVRVRVRACVRARVCEYV